jgi:hypothetical protein
MVDTCAFSTPPAKRKPVPVSGSWGTIRVDPYDGWVVQLTDEPYEYKDGERGYRDIERFDIAEWLKFYPNEEFNGCDILDIGYWLKDGTYEPPCGGFREELAKGDDILAI